MLKSKDMLYKKQTELANLQAASRDAISVVTNTLSSLETVNSDIEAKINEIENYQTELNKARDSLGTQFSQNLKIISKFRTFLED